MDLLNGYNSSDNDDADKEENTSKKGDDATTTTTEAAAGGGGEGNTNTTSSSALQLQPVAKRVDRRYLRAAPGVSALTAGKGKASQPSRSTALVTTTSNSFHNRVANKSSGSELVLMNNPSKAVLYEPIQGPSSLGDPNNSTAITTSKGIPGIGQKEDNVAFDETTFNEQRTKFQRTGVAMAPDETGTIIQRSTLGYDRKRIQSFKQKEEDYRLNTNKRPRPNDGKKQQEQQLVYDSNDEVEYGVWGPPTEEEKWASEQTLTDIDKVGKDALQPEQLAEREYIKERNRQRGIMEENKEQMSNFDRIMERKMAHLLPPTNKNQKEGPMEPTISIFHAGKENEYNFKGQSWITIPSGYGILSVTASTSLNSNDPIPNPDVHHHKCYVPKKCIHRYNTNNVNVKDNNDKDEDGNDKKDNNKDKKNDSKKNNNTKMGIHRIRLFPGTGHLLLAAGLNGLCYVFSVHIHNNSQKDKDSSGGGTRLQLMRTYFGHYAAVRDVQFNLNGTKFVSCSFDRYIRLWDTESGNVVQTFSNGKVPYCVQFFPYDDNLFVVGCSDNKIITYDCTTALITQEYNHHLAPVNAIAFTDPENEGGDGGGTIKMITSSDDKTILIWEWDIGVPIKYISDPTMHSMPVITMHPTKQFFMGQSLDNSIQIFQCNSSSNKFKLQKKKKFIGHTVAGYACDITVSTDGQYLCCGDGNGKLYFWDWKRSRILQKYRAHDNGPTIGCIWHPLEPSIVFSCGWDGIIKIWQ